MEKRKTDSFRYGLFSSPKLLNNQKNLKPEKIAKLPTLGFSRTANHKAWNLVNKLASK